MDKDITKVELELWGQKLRDDTYINTLLCPTPGAATCISAADQATKKYDAAGQATKQWPVALLNRIVALKEARSATWANPYASVTAADYTPATLLSFFYQANAVYISYNPWHKQEWQTLIDGAKVYKGASATTTGSIWKEIEDMKAVSTPPAGQLPIATDVLIAASGIYNGATAVTTA